MKIDPDYKIQVSITREKLVNKEIALATVGEDTPSNMKIRAEYGIPTLHYELKEVTPGEFMKYVLEGRAISHIFKPYNSNDPFPYFTKGDKNMEGFLGARCIFFDIDHTNYKSIGEYIHKLGLKPTLAYTTYSNDTIDPETKKNKGLRFRMIYAFEDAIEGYYWYRYCAYCINKYILSCVGPGEELDESNLRATQFFYGTYYQPDDNEEGMTETAIRKKNRNKPSKVCYSYIHRLSDFGITQEGYIDFLLHFCHYTSNYRSLDKYKNERERHSEKIKKILKKLTGKNYKLKVDVYRNDEDKIRSRYYYVETENPSEDDDMMVDIDNIPFELPSFMSGRICDTDLHPQKICSGWTYGVIRHNPFTRLGFHTISDQFHNQELFYRTEPEDGWIPVDKSINGKRYEWTPVPENYIELNSYIIKKGSNRLNQIYIRALIRRLIKPSTDANELLLNAVFDVVFLCENYDGKLTPNELIEKVEKAMSYTLDEIKRLPEVICHIPYLKNPPKDGILIREIKDQSKIEQEKDDSKEMSVRKYIRYQRIHDVCDPAKTDKENITIVKDRLGIDISTKTLMRIRKKYGEMKYKHHI